MQHQKTTSHKSGTPETSPISSKSPMSALVNEDIFFGKLLAFLYTNRWAGIIRFFVRQKWISKLLGWYYDSRFSRRHIAPFVARFNVNMHDAVRPPEAYISFNDFFTRTLLPSARPVDQDTYALVSPCDGALTVYPAVSGDTVFYAKSMPFTLECFLQDAQLARRFEHGTLLLFRLAPADYHRYHFPVAGVPSVARAIGGVLNSVHPIAWSRSSVPLLENERHCTLIDAAEFGTIAFVSIGALCVGKIIETYTPKTHASKGEEMGYFAFGGSMLAVLLEPDQCVVDPRLLTRSSNGIETIVRMGEAVAWKQ